MSIRETKAARMAAISRLEAEGRLVGVSDADLAEAFGCRRETIWRDRQALARADQLYQRFLAAAPPARGYTKMQAARILGTPVYNIRAWITRGDLHGHKDDRGVWRIPASEIERLQRTGLPNSRPGPKPTQQSEGFPSRLARS